MWIAQPQDRGSMNGRPVLFVRERNAAGAPGDPVAAVFMNYESRPGLIDAEGHARMIAMAPRMATYLAMLFENACSIPPGERSEALQRAADLHTELTGEPDRYQYPAGEPDEGGGEAVHEEVAA